MSDLQISNLDDNHPYRQWLHWQIPGTQLEIEGYSRAADRTFFYLPQIKVCLDAGLSEARQGDHIFVTHGHSDHIEDVEYLSSKPGAVLYVPQEITGILRTYIESRRHLAYADAYDPSRPRPCEIVGLKPNEEIEFGYKSLRFSVCAIDCHHSAPCLGYAFSEIRHRLRPEFETVRDAFLSRNDQKGFSNFLAGKREAGEEVKEEFAEPLFVYLGDTYISAFEEQPGIFDYPVVITECSYFLPEEHDLGKERAHIHWEDLRPYVLAHPEVVFVLSHFSLRYEGEEIHRFFEREQETYGFENVKLWVSRAPVLEERGQKF